MIRGKVTMKQFQGNLFWFELWKAYTTRGFEKSESHLTLPGPYGVKMTEGLKNIVKPCILKHMPKGLLSFSSPWRCSGIHFVLKELCM